MRARHRQPSVPHTCCRSSGSCFQDLSWSHAAAGRVLPPGSAASGRPSAELSARGTHTMSALQVQRGWRSMCGLKCESLKRCTRSLGSPGHRLPSSQWLYRQMRPSRCRSANESRCRSLRPPERRQNVVSARSAGALGGETRAFEVRLHLLTPTKRHVHSLCNVRYYSCIS